MKQQGNIIVKQHLENFFLSQELRNELLDIKTSKNPQIKLL